MEAENFVQWLNGYYDLNEESLTRRQNLIYRKLKTDMKPLDYCYWLQGFYELLFNPLSQWDSVVNDHLQLVFTKVTPAYETDCDLIGIPGDDVVSFGPAFC